MLDVHGDGLGRGHGSGGARDGHAPPCEWPTSYGAQPCDDGAGSAVGGSGGTLEAAVAGAVEANRGEDERGGVLRFHCHSRYAARPLRRSQYSRERMAIQCFRWTGRAQDRG